MNRYSGGRRRSFTPIINPEHPSFVDLGAESSEELSYVVAGYIDSTTITTELPLETYRDTEHHIIGLSLDLFPSPYLIDRMNALSLNRRYDFIDISVIFSAEMEPEFILRFYNQPGSAQASQDRPLLLSRDDSGYVFYLEGQPEAHSFSTKEQQQGYTTLDLIYLIESIRSSEPMSENPADNGLDEYGRLIRALELLKVDAIKIVKKDTYRHAWQDDATIAPYSEVIVEHVKEKKAYMLEDEKEVTTVKSVMLEYFKPNNESAELRTVITFTYLFEKDESGDINYSFSGVEVHNADTGEELPAAIRNIILRSLTKSSYSPSDFAGTIKSAVLDVFVPLDKRDIETE